jgi:SAM-dependent methyltransferase
MLTPDEIRYFEEMQALLEPAYLAGTNPRAQSGSSRDAEYWERYRRPIVLAMPSDGTFLDVGCANGHLMECVAAWAREDGRAIEPYGLDISEKLAELARRRLPRWRDRIFVGNAFLWEPPCRFNYVRTELVYVPPTRRREYVERLLREFVAPGGRLLACSYGSSRPEGVRTEPIADEIRGYGLEPDAVHDVVSPERGYVVTRVVSLRR